MPGAFNAARRVRSFSFPSDIQESILNVFRNVRVESYVSPLITRLQPVLKFELRITTFVRGTTEQAWRGAEAKVAKMAKQQGAGWDEHDRRVAVGQPPLRWRYWD